MKKHIFALAILFCYCTGFSQKDKDTTDLYLLLVKNRWITDQIIGLDSLCNTYILHLDKAQPRFVGYITQFTNDQHFSSRYVSWCGNDRFINLTGTYQRIDNDKIAFTPQNITTLSMDMERNEALMARYNCYLIVSSEKGLVLKRIEDE